MSERKLDIAIVGAGPVGLEAAISARRHGLAARVWDRGPLCAAVVDYPTNMVFFTSNELLEIGNHPLVTGGPKATRREALDYYRKVAEREQLNVVTYTEVTAVVPVEGGFQLESRGRNGVETAACATVIVATGYYSNPRLLGVPGEELPHVSHYYGEAHPQWRQRVVVVGGGNSAVEAALELYRAGANVTLLVRGGSVKDTVKYWLKPDIEHRIVEGAVSAHFGATVERITQTHVHCRVSGEQRMFPADHVLLATGYFADSSLVSSAGAKVREDGSVVLDPRTFETTLPGVFVIGSAGFGPRTGEVFIENGRLHARAAVATIAARLSQETQE